MARRAAANSPLIAQSSAQASRKLVQAWIATLKFGVPSNVEQRSRTARSEDRHDRDSSGPRLVAAFHRTCSASQLVGP